jgi:hypothetical protein
MQIDAWASKTVNLPATLQKVKSCESLDRAGVRIMSARDEQAERAEAGRQLHRRAEPEEHLFEGRQIPVVHLDPEVVDERVGEGDRECKAVPAPAPDTEPPQALHKGASFVVAQLGSFAVREEK